MGGGVSLPNTTRYREEYLVDTETNEIIYPKVLPSSITIPPGNTEGVNPSLIGGIDPSSYYTKLISLAGKDVRLASYYYERLLVPYTGLVDVYVSFSPNGSNFGSISNTEMSIQVRALAEDGTVYDTVSNYKHVINMANCWPIITAQAILPIVSNTIEIVIGAASCTTWCKFSSKAFIQFKAIKLCDLPN